MLLYARIQAPNNKGAPGWPKGPKKIPKIAKKTILENLDKENIIVC